MTIDKRQGSLSEEESLTYSEVAATGAGGTGADKTGTACTGALTAPLLPLLLFLHSIKFKSVAPVGRMSIWLKSLVAVAAGTTRGRYQDMQEATVSRRSDGRILAWRWRDTDVSMRASLFIALIRSLLGESGP